MPKLNVPPTKSSQLSLRRDVAFAREGFEMLDQKRQILVLELMGTVEAAKRAQQEVAEKMAAAFEALREAAIAAGSFAMSGEAEAVRTEHRVDIESRPLMGIHLPTVSGEHGELRPAYSLAAGTPKSDEARAAFTEALGSIDRLAEVENRVFRLAREVRKTQRRVNALEKIFIPDYEETLKFVADTLEEREREEFVIMRMVRERLERQREPAHTQPEGT